MLPRFEPCPLLSVVPVHGSADDSWHATTPSCRPCQDRLGCARYDGGRASLPPADLLIRAPDHFSCRQAARAVDRFLNLAMNLHGRAGTEQSDRADRSSSRAGADESGSSDQSSKKIIRPATTGRLAVRKTEPCAQNGERPLFCVSTQVILQQRITEALYAKYAKTQNPGPYRSRRRRRRIVRGGCRFRGSRLGKGPQCDDHRPTAVYP